MTASTRTDISNRALYYSGSKVTIEDFDTSTSVEAIACRQHFDDVYASLLRGFPWTRATVRSALPAMSEAPAFDFTKQYELPPHCVAVRHLYDAEPEEAWGVETYVNGAGVEIPVIVCNVSAPLKIVWTRLVQNIAVMPVDFRNGLALALGADLAVTLSGNFERQQVLLQRAENAINEAAEADSKEGSEDFMPVSPVVRQREERTIWPVTVSGTVQSFT